MLESISSRPGTVVITGGTKGIGASLSRTFHAAGYRVVVAARHDNGLATELGENAAFFAVDVRSSSELDGLATFAVDRFGGLDVWINNAGYSAWRPLGQVTDEFWQDISDTNLKGTLFGCRAASRFLKAGGSLLNVSSLAGKRGSANNAVYCATKFAVNGITQALAKELGSRGVRVNAVCPVLVTTPGLVEALKEEHAPAFENRVEVFLAGFAKSQSALGRLPTGEEVAQVCLFLASPAASAITGQCLNVDCGVLPQ